jgi:hypothetical protein
VASALEVLAQGGVVVDLAVHDHGDRAVLGVEGLVAASDVDDRQTRVRQRGRAGAVHAVGVGPAMAQRLDHPLPAVGGRGPGRIE